jgi:hypothetical protein
MPQENHPQQTLEMRVAEIEDKLRKIYFTEEELKALKITDEELKTFHKVAAALAQRCRPVPYYVPCCSFVLPIGTPGFVGYPVPGGPMGFGSLGS